MFRGTYGKPGNLSLSGLDFGSSPDFIQNQKKPYQLQPEIPPGTYFQVFAPKLHPQWRLHQPACLCRVSYEGAVMGVFIHGVTSSHPVNLAEIFPGKKTEYPGDKQNKH